MYFDAWDTCLEVVLSILSENSDFDCAKKRIEDLQVLVKTKNFELIKSSFGAKSVEPGYAEILVSDEVYLKLERSAKRRGVSLRDLVSCLVLQATLLGTLLVGID
jgi:hypothetical protein